MYLKKRVLSILLILSSMAYGQQKITVIDAVTKEPIPYSKIRYYNDDGMFSNEKGMFQLNVAKADSITIFATGYKTQGFRIKKGDSLLEMKSIEKVVINLKRKIKKTIKKNEKGYWHNTYLKCMQPNMGSEVAVYIPCDKLKKMLQLTKILIPVKTSTYVIINNKITSEEKKQPFKTIFKIQFYKNENNFPGELLYNNYFLTEVTESSSDFQEIDLKSNPITIPNEGLFVGILFLGKSTETGELFPPFKERIAAKGLYKFPYSINPPLPITGEIAEERSFIRSSFNNNTWSSFTKVYSRYTLLKDYPFLNLGLGYELEMHE